MIATTSAPTVQDLLLNAFRRYADRISLRWEGGSATYRQTEARVRGLAWWLQTHTPDEAHIAILLPNCREYIEGVLACAVAGRVRVPLNVKDPLSVQVLKVKQSGCAVVLTNDQWRQELANEMRDLLPQIVLVGARAKETYNYDDLVESSADRDLLPTTVAKRFRLSFTGGTTGTPKAVVQTHRQEIAMIRNLLLEAIHPEQQSVFVHSMPIAHASGSFILPVALGGGAMAWTDGFLPDRLVHSAWLGDSRLRIQTFLVPTALGDLSGAIGPSGHDLDTVIYGGAPCAMAVLEQAVERIGLRLIEVYGQAEAPMTICVLPARDHADPGSVAGCIGYPFMFVDIRIREKDWLTARPGAVGELVVRAEHIMEGYWKNPEATSEKLLPDGSLRTQDVGYRDEQGRFWLSGRTRDMIISGGYNVFPAEVERRLGNIEGISQLVVIGAPHPRWGESLVAVVVPDSEVFDESRLTLRVEGVSKSQLAEYERPKRVVFLDNLPTTSLGKVARRELEQRLRGIFTSQSTD